MSCCFFLFSFFFFVIAASEQEFRHGADIVQRPHDVIGMRCGDDVHMTCTARSTNAEQVDVQSLSSLPDMEWWSKKIRDDETELKKIYPQEGVEVYTEVFYVVRSTLVMKKVKASDEGVYQCRASSNTKRNDPDVNFYQYWAIEEAPLKNLKCPKNTSQSFNDNINKNSENIKKGEKQTRNPKLKAATDFTKSPLPPQSTTPTTTTTTTTEEHETSPSTTTSSSTTDTPKNVEPVMQGQDLGSGSCRLKPGKICFFLTLLLLLLMMTII